MKLKDQPGLDNKNVTCPICSKKSRIGDCERITEKKEQDNDATQYKSEPKRSSEDTILNTDPATPVGRLVNTQTGSTSQLKIGKNTIGRRVANPLPTVTNPIEEMQSNKTMSREHAIIEVTRLQNGSFRHFLYNWKNKNATCVDGTPLNGDDRVVLCHGQTIKMGQVLLRFEILKKTWEDTTL